MLKASKLRYALQIFAPLAFLPLRRAYLWPLLFPGILLTLLTTDYKPATSIAFQYNFHWIPYIFPAAIWMAAEYGKTSRSKQRAAVTAVFVGVLLSSVCFGPLSPKGTIRAGFFNIDFEPPTALDEARRQTLHEFAARIGPDETVAVADRELPHVSNRKYVYTLKNGTFDADYLLYSTYRKKWGYLGADRAETERKDGTYDLIATKKGIVLLRKSR